MRLLSSTSILLPITTCSNINALNQRKIGSWVHTKGKLSGSMGLAWIRNSSLQLSRVSKLLALFTS